MSVKFKYFTVIILCQCTTVVQQLSLLFQYLQIGESTWCQNFMKDITTKQIKASKVLNSMFILVKGYQQKILSIDTNAVCIIPDSLKAIKCDYLCVFWPVTVHWSVTTFLELSQVAWLVSNVMTKGGPCHLG